MPCAPKRFVGRFVRLIGVAPMPECQCPAGDRGNAAIRAEPRVERRMLPGSIGRHRAFEMQSCRRVVPDCDQCPTNEPMPRR